MFYELLSCKSHHRNDTLQRAHEKHGTLLRWVQMISFKCLYYWPNSQSRGWHWFHWESISQNSKIGENYYFTKWEINTNEAYFCNNYFFQTVFISEWTDSHVISQEWHWDFNSFHKMKQEIQQMRWVKVTFPKMFALLIMSCLRVAEMVVFTEGPFHKKLTLRNID